MLAKLQSVAVSGIEATLLQVEVDISSGIPGMTIVGLPDAAVRESKDRVKAAVNNSRFQFPFKKLTVNLAPADIRKEGPCYDLPIAVGTLMAMGDLPVDACDDYALVGELSLEGELSPIKGALSMAIAAKERGSKGIILPHVNAVEASVVEGIEVIAVKSLLETVEFLNGSHSIQPLTKQSCPTQLVSELSTDFNEVIGQESAKRAMLVAAAGGHNILMVGPPGSGKTMLAQRLPGILPPLSFEESLETTRVYSVIGSSQARQGLMQMRPFRSPHHTISDAGLTGGGSRPRPGEISLAHNGVLFLDELPEFKRSVLEVLRQPIEEGQVTISRAHSTITYPARFMFVASMNPCPCGYFGDSSRPCACTPNQVERYVNRISGPLLDRIDIHVEVESLPTEKLAYKKSGASSSELREQVTRMRDIQSDRFSGQGIASNAQMSSRQMAQYCELNRPTQNLLIQAMEELGFSARSYHRILKVARTLADLEGEQNIQEHHIAEAIHFRTLDRKLWMP